MQKRSRHLTGRALLIMLNAQATTQMHDDATRLWHRQAAPTLGEDEFLRLALAQHRANYDLWHEEDAARSLDVSDATIASVKHAIDSINQRRNDLVEQIDAYLLEEAGPQNEAAPLNSESPGLIVDRLSILALKIYHTDEEAHRNSADDTHRARNLSRLQVLLQQRLDLAACLDALWSEVRAGRRRFRLYRQMKMYNDPELNPVLYGRGH